MLMLLQQLQVAIKLRWATKQGDTGPSRATGATISTKSLAEIQAEEAAQLGNMNLAAAGA